MSWLASLSTEEKQEYYKDSCDAFQASLINEREFRMALVMLGHNATDIEEAVKFYRPPPPENEDGP